MNRRFAPHSLQEYGAVLPQWLGMLGVVACFIFWAFTGRLEPLLLSAFGGLIFVGQAGEAFAILVRSPPEPPTTTEITEPARNGAA